MKNYLLLLFLATIFTFSSCGKDDDNDPTAGAVDPANDPAAIQLTTQLLTANQWELTGLTQGVSGQAISNDIYNNAMPACQHDEVYNFTENGGSMHIDLGLISCSATDKNKYGTWNLKNANILTINVADLTQAGLTGEFRIVTLDNNKMILHQVSNGSEFIATYEKHLAYTKTQLLTTNTWTIASIIEERPGSQPSDIFTTFAPCEKDNRFIFKTNGTYDIDESSMKCAPSDPQLMDTGNWQFTNNETQLSVNGDMHDILQLSESKMILKSEDSGIKKTTIFWHK